MPKAFYSLNKSIPSLWTFNTQFNANYKHCNLFPTASLPITQFNWTFAYFPFTISAETFSRNFNFQIRMQIPEPCQLMKWLFINQTVILRVYSYVHVIYLSQVHFLNANYFHEAILNRVISILYAMDWIMHESSSWKCRKTDNLYS